MAFIGELKAQCRKTFSRHGLWSIMRALILPEPVSIALELRDRVEEADGERQEKTKSASPPT
jgi:hypothetical protein